MSNSSDLITARKAILGVANENAAVLQQVVDGMNDFIQKLYTNIRERQALAVKNAETSYSPMLIGSAESKAALAQLNQDVLELNSGVQRIQSKLSFFNEQTTQSPKQLLETSEALSGELKQVQDKNQSLNQRYQAFEKQFGKVTMLTGSAPSEDLQKRLAPVAETDLSAMTETVDKNIQSLNTQNNRLKESIRVNLEQEQKAGIAPVSSPTITGPRK